jgi:hypothetical protein
VRKAAEEARRGGREREGGTRAHVQPATWVLEISPLCPVRVWRQRPRRTSQILTVWSNEPVMTRSPLLSKFKLTI